MKIVFAHNVFDRFKTLKETINAERKFFPESHEYIVCNSHENKDFFNQIENISVKYYLETPEHKIGCVNGLMLSCNMALEKEFDVLVFSHDDIRLVPNNIDVVRKHINNIFINEFDVIYRNPKWLGIDYAMMEIVFFGRKAIETLFSKITLLKTDTEIGFYNGSVSPEFWFYNQIKKTNLITEIISYDDKNQIVTQMGYEHLNSGKRGWKD